MLTARTSLNRITKVIITHMHGDHVMGLPGLLQTMALLNRERKIDIYGPSKIKEFLRGISETVQFVLTFPIEIHEINRAGIVCEEEQYAVNAIRAKHVVPSFSYAYIEKPRPGTFYPDKAKALNVPEGPMWSNLQKGRNVKLPNGNVVKPEDVLERFAANADVLIHDCTLGDELAARAQVYGHSTVDQAAKAAKKAKVKQLILTHISQRYEETDIWLEQARRIFKNTMVAKDFMKLDVPSLE
jgi:ribonuclease Z